MTQTILRTVGVFAIILGIVGVLDGMHIVRVHSPLIDWMERYGEYSAWAIRLGTIGVGAALLFLTPRADT